MNEIDPIVLEIDDRPVQAAVKRSNASIDGMRDKTARAGREMESAWERQARQMEKISKGVESYGNSFERVLKGLAASTRGATEFATAAFLGAKAIAAQTSAVGGLEAAWNRVRAVRIGAAAVTEGLGGALVVGSEIAAAIALERVATATYARSKEIQSQALRAQQTGFTYEDRSALDFTAQRAGRPTDYYDSAVKSAGGVDKLAKSLRELGDVKDPITRAEMAFREFGPDADRVLASLGDRFGDNAERAKSWGIALDEVSRSRIDSFRRAVDAIRGTFDGLSDSLATTKRQLGALFELDLSSIWELMTRGPGTLWSAIKPPIAFSADTLDLKGAQRDIQGRSSTNATALAQQEMLRTLTPAAERRFQTDVNAVDQEPELRSQIATLQKQLFDQDRTSGTYGKLISGAQFPGGYGAEAQAVQLYVSEQNQLAGVIAKKKEDADLDAAKKKALQELESAQRAVAGGLQSAQLAELSGADRLRAERDNAISQYGKTRDLVRDINKEFDIRFGIEGKAIIAQSDADMRARAAAEATSQTSQLTARTGYTSRAILDTIRISGEAPAKRDDLEMQRAGLDRESQLRDLEAVDARTLAQKAAVEQKKLGIETNYFQKAQELEVAGVDRAYEKELRDLQTSFDARLITWKAYMDQAKALDVNEQLDVLKIHERTDAEVLRSGVETAKAIRQEYQRELSVIQDEAAHLLGALFTDPSHFGKQLAETIRAAFLKPVISGLSNDIAKSLQPVIYGGGTNNGAGGGFSFSGMANALGIRQQPQQDWSLSAATKQGVLAGYSIFSGTPVYNLRGNKNSPLGDFDPASGTINMYAAAHKSLYSADEMPWGAARTFIHEDTHALLNSKNINALNAMLPPEFVKQSIQGLVKSNHYSDSDAAREIIPRLVTNEETGASGFNQQKIFRDFIGTLKPQDARLSETLSSMGQATGAYPGGPSDSPAINDLLRSTRPLNDYQISASSSGGFSFPTNSGGFSSQPGVPTGVSGLNAVFGDNPAAMLGPGGTAGFVGGGWGGFSNSGGFSGFGSSQQAGVPTGMSAVRALLGSTGTGTSSSYGQSQVPGSGEIVGGVKTTLSDLKQVNWGSFMHKGTPGTDLGIDPATGQDLGGDPGDSGGGGISGVGGLAGAGMQMGGMYLAQRGLLGQDRGTGKGIAEGTAGGAIVGFQQGGLIGAGVGAAVGFGIGLGEMVAGVESPENKAIRLIKQLYRIDINIQMARQIVQIANSKYGTNIDFAIRSPEVRQMLQLYSAGTGQAGKMPLSSTTPMGASLIEQGGKLYQGQQYQFGNAYVSQSSLSVLGGGSPSTLPNPGPTYVTLAFDGQNAGDAMRGSFVTPSFVQSQFSAAQQSSNGRLQNSAMVQQPGLITG